MELVGCLIKAADIHKDKHSGRNVSYNPPEGVGRRQEPRGVQGKHSGTVLLPLHTGSCQSTVLSQQY